MRPPGRGDGRLDWGAVYAQHAPRLRRVVARRVPAAVVDDVVQETFLRAFRHRHAYDAAQPIGPWLTTIAIRVASDVAQQPTTASPVPEDARVADDASAELTAQTQVALVRRALDSLSARHRRLLEAVAVDGMSQATIAHEEGVAPEVIRSTVLRARQRFRVVYERLTHEHGLVGLGSSLQPALARLRVRLLPVEAHVPRKAEGLVALVAAVAIGAGSVAGDAAPARPVASVADAAGAHPGPVVLTTAAAAGTGIDDPGVGVSTRLPGGGIDGNLSSEGGLDVSAFWTLDLEAIGTTVTVGSDGQTAGVWLETRIDDPYGDSRSHGGSEVYCNTGSMTTPTTCWTLDVAEEHLRSVK